MLRSVRRRGAGRGLLLSLALTLTAGTAAAPRADALGGANEGTAIVAAPGGNGYAIISKTGGQYNYGGSGFSGSLAGMPLNAPIVDAVAVPGEADAKWFVAADGGVFSMGTSKFYGSMGGQHLNAPITAIVASATGAGYLLVAQDGGTFAFGDFTYPGSLAGMQLNAPIVDAATTPDGHGLWMTAADGGVFTFGTASFYGSLGSIHLNAPITAILPSLTGAGYLLVGQDGGTFAHGDFPFPGSLAGTPLNAPIVDAAVYQNTSGVWLTASDGGVFTLNAPFYGAATDQANPPPDYPGTANGSSGGTMRVVCPTGGRTEVAAQIAENVRRLYAAAAAAGLNRVCGWGYRTYEQQVALRRAHCGNTNYDIYDKPSTQCTPPTARPGTSMHEKGLAIDFTNNGSSIGASDPFYAWLHQNAVNYGLQNYPKETWHWSTNGR
jgi:hypothetical protein